VAVIAEVIEAVVAVAAVVLLAFERYRLGFGVAVAVAVDGMVVVA
jgi:hypothetical protein